jgi:hypothetical protein
LIESIMFLLFTIIIFSDQVGLGGCFGLKSFF